jgi:hypothetical protein
VYFLVNVFILVACYRLAFQLGRRDAAILGVMSGIALAATMWLMIPKCRFPHFLAAVATGIVVLVPSFYLCARREGMLVAVVNVAIGSSAALFLPTFVLGWMRAL